MTSSTKRYVITNTVQSDGNPPADVTWYRGTDHAQALAALVNAGAQEFSAEIDRLMGLRLIAVRMEIFEVLETGLAEPECSGLTGGPLQVPYCTNNEGGCPIHYPSETAGL